MRALRIVLGMVALLASSTAAHAFDLCKLASAKTYIEASAVIESAGCSVAKESGTRKRSFSCGDGGWAELEADTGGVTIVISGFPASGTDTRCAGATWTVAEAYDNPLVLRAYGLGPSYSPVARAAVLSVDGQKAYLTWLCNGTSLSCRLMPEGGLRPVLERYLGNDTLTFEKSEVRVAGLDITRASKADFERELAARGAKIVSQSGGPLVSKTTFGDVTGVPGLTAIDATYLAGRITSIRYVVANDADFSVFARSLDERYGASKSSLERGCTVRRWTNGGVAVLGEICAASPARNGFTFINVGASDIVDGLNKLVAAPVALPTKPTAKPRTDMY